jgi:octanoyl-[GcvH]:protein N-octanoyltransferase
MVNSAFGDPFDLIDDTAQDPEKRPTALAYAEWVKTTLERLRAGGKGIVRFRVPRPTAALSPQDTSHAQQDKVKAQMRARGFEPIERGTGGRLTVFDEKAFAVAIIAPHEDSKRDILQRFELLSSVIASALKSLDIDARVGEIPNEYCPGKYSINAEGRVKLVGVAQRITSHVYQMGAVITIERSTAAIQAIAEAYKTMALPFDEATYGSVTELRTDVTAGAAQKAIRSAVLNLLL